MSLNFWESIEENDINALRSILKKEGISFNKNVKDSFGLSPILLALSKSNVHVANVLISENFDVNVKDKKGQTALHYCAFYNFIDVATLLLRKNASVNVEDDYGNQPLWTAVFNDKGLGKRMEIIKLLLNAGADAKHKNKSGRSPLDFAQNAGYTDVAEMLVSS